MPDLIDTNVHAFAWPFRKLSGDRPVELAEQLARAGVKQAWVGSFEGVLHRDIDGVNRRLTEACRKSPSGTWLPFGVIHPGLPDWEEDLRRCVEVYRMAGIRLYPNYHQYRLDSDQVAGLFRTCHDAGLIVQIALMLEDPRTQHPLVQVPHVDPLRLVPLLKSFPDLPVVLLNAFRAARLDRLETVVQAGNVCLELATMEGAASLERIVRSIPADRLLFGSHAPFYYLQSAVLKLETAEIGALQRQAIGAGNARKLAASSGRKR